MTIVGSIISRFQTRAARSQAKARQDFDRNSKRRDAGKNLIKRLDQNRIQLGTRRLIGTNVPERPAWEYRPIANINSMSVEAANTIAELWDSIVQRAPSRLDPFLKTKDPQSYVSRICKLDRFEFWLTPFAIQQMGVDNLVSLRAIIPQKVNPDPEDRKTRPSVPDEEALYKQILNSIFRHAIANNNGIRWDKIETLIALGFPIEAQHGDSDFTEKDKHVIKRLARQICNKVLTQSGCLLYIQNHPVKTKLDHPTTRYRNTSLAKLSFVFLVKITPTEIQANLEEDRGLKGFFRTFWKFKPASEEPADGHLLIPFSVPYEESPICFDPCLGPFNSEGSPVGGYLPLDDQEIENTARRYRRKYFCPGSVWETRLNEVGYFIFLPDITLLALGITPKTHLKEGEEADLNELAASFSVHDPGSVLYKDFDQSTLPDNLKMIGLIHAIHTLDRDKDAVMNSLIATKTLKGIPQIIQTLVTTFISFANKFYQFPQGMLLDHASATRIFNRTLATDLVLPLPRNEKQEKHNNKYSSRRAKNVAMRDQRLAYIKENKSE